MHSFNNHWDLCLVRRWMQNGFVTELRLSCSLLKSQDLRDKCWWEKKVCSIQKPGNLGKRQTHVQELTPNYWSEARGFKGEFQGCPGEGRGLRAEQHCQLWRSSWNWSCGGLISVILIVFSTVNLQFQDCFVPILFFFFFWLTSILLITLGLIYKIKVRDEKHEILEWKGFRDNLIQCSTICGFQEFLQRVCNSICTCTFSPLMELMVFTLNPTTPHHCWILKLQEPFYLNRLRTIDLVQFSVN